MKTTAVILACLLMGCATPESASIRNEDAEYEKRLCEAPRWWDDRWDRCRHRDVPIFMTTNHLPTKCRPLYNDGSGDWAECMGVGYVR